MIVLYLLMCLFPTIIYYTRLGALVYPFYFLLLSFYMGFFGHGVIFPFCRSFWGYFCMLVLIHSLYIHVSPYGLLGLIFYCVLDREWHHLL